MMKVYQISVIFVLVFLLHSCTNSKGFDLLSNDNKCVEYAFLLFNESLNKFKYDIDNKEHFMLFVNDLAVSDSIRNEYLNFINESMDDDICNCIPILGYRDTVSKRNYFNIESELYHELRNQENDIIHLKKFLDLMEYDTPPFSIKHTYISGIMADVYDDELFHFYRNLFVIDMVMINEFCY